MPLYRVTSPDGAVYNVNSPDGASDQDMLARTQAVHAASTLSSNLSAPDAGPTLSEIASTRPIPDGTYPRQAACTAAGLQCVQDGFPPKACYDAEQHCNNWSYIYRNLPPSPLDHTLTNVFPNGSTVIIPPGYDPVLGPRIRPFGQAPTGH